MRLNTEATVHFCYEHIGHLEDLFENLADDAILQASLRDIKLILDRTLEEDRLRKHSTNRLRKEVDDAIKNLNTP